MDFFFDCPSCNGSLVADDTCVGESTACPHCAKWILIPPCDSPLHDPPHREGAGVHSIDETVDPSLARQDGVPARSLIDPILVRELEEVRGKYRKLKEDYDDLELKMKWAGAEVLKKQITSLTSERDVLGAELVKIKEKLETVQIEFEQEKQNQISELEKVKQQWVETRSQRLDAIQALEFANARVLELQNECQTLQVKVDAGRSELEGCRLKLHKSRNEQQVLIAGADRVERELKAVNEALKLELEHKEHRTQQESGMKVTLSRIEKHLLEALTEIKFKIEQD